MLGAYYLRLVLSRWKLVAALVVGCTLAAFLVTALILVDKPKFEAAARLNIVPTSEELGYANRFVRGSTFDGGSTLLQTYAEFAHTRPVVAPIVDRYVAEQAAAAGQSEDAWIAANSVPPAFSPSRLYSTLNYGSAPPLPLREDIVESLIEHTTIETVEGTYLLRITVQWDDAKGAAWFANALSDAIIARAERMSDKSGSQIATNLQTSLAGKQAELAAVLKRSRDMKQAVGVVDIDQQKQSLLAAQIEEQSRLTSDQATFQASQSQVAGLRRQSGGKLSTAQDAIDKTLAVEGPKAAGIARGIAIRQGRVAQIRGQIATLGRHEDMIRSLDDRAQQLRAEVAALTERVSFSQTENLANAPRIQLIERAVPPLVRTSPKMLLNVAFGFVAGCALAACALLLLGEAPVRVRQEDDEPVEIPEDRVTPEPAAPVERPRRRWSEIMPGAAAAKVVEMPRPYPQAGAPVFATSGSLALARDEHAESEQVRPTSVRAEPVDALPVSDPEGEEGQRFDKALPSEVDKLGANGEGVRSELSAQLEAPRARPALTLVPESVPLADRVFGYLLPAPRDGRRYDAAETRGIGTQLASWLGAALAGDQPLTVVSVGDDVGAQRLYQLLHDYRAATGEPIATVDWSAGARALPRVEGKPLIYAGGGFGSGAILAHRDGAVVVAVAADDAQALEAEARRLSIFAGRAVHVVPLGD